MASSKSKNSFSVLDNLSENEEQFAIESANANQRSRGIEKLFLVFECLSHFYSKGFTCHDLTFSFRRTNRGVHIWGESFRRSHHLG
jgi:hypothetical protein